MDLQNIKPVEFKKRLDKIEDEATDPVMKTRFDCYSAIAVFVGFVGGLVFGMMMGMALGLMLGITSPLAMLPFAVLGGIVLPAIAVWRYVAVGKQVMLSRVLGPQGRAFLKSNADRRDRLLAAAGAYNGSIGGLKLLTSGNDSEAVEGLAESMENRREALLTELEAYLHEFSESTCEDRRRFNPPPAPPAPNKGGERKRRIRAFKERVAELKRLERSLDLLPSADDARLTVDLSPFIAAARIRTELDRERLELGLPKMALPPSRMVKTPALPPKAAVHS